jgi:hypothetical protein
MTPGTASAVTRRVTRILSGGQTGVDRAALDWALAHGIEHGGWCPRGRRAEDGPIDARYRLHETASADYAVRTRRNVAEADATLVLNRGPLAGGTLHTIRHAKRIGRPCLVVALDAPDLDAEVRRTREWWQALQAGSLNVAGPRESGRPGIHGDALAFLECAFGDADPIDK